MSEIDRQGDGVELTTTIYVVVAALIGGAFVYLMLRRDADDGTPPTADSVLGTVQDAFGIAQALVAAAEQLSETGQIDKGTRFQYAFTRLRELFPNLSQDTLIAAIEAGVYLVTKAGALLEVDADTSGG